MAKSGTYRTSHVEVFVRSLRLPIITRQGGQPPSPTTVGSRTV